MYRLLFLLPLAAGAAGIVAAGRQIVQVDHQLAYDFLFAGGFYGALIGAGGMLGIVRPKRRAMRIAGVAEADGFKEVLSGKSIAERRSENLLMLIGGVFLAVALSVNKFKAHATMSIDLAIFIFGLLAPVVFLVIQLVRIWQLSRAVAQPRIFVAPIPIRRGAPLQIRLAVEAKRPLERLSLRAWLLCIETDVVFHDRRTRFPRENVVERVAADQDQENVAAGEVVSTSFRLTISKGTPQSGKFSIRRYPHYQWLLHLELSGSRNYITEYPLEIN
jgi:hypothetical protein